MNFIIGEEAEELFAIAEASNNFVAFHKYASGTDGVSDQDYLEPSLTRVFTVRNDPKRARMPITCVDGPEKEILQYFNGHGGEWLTDMIIDLSDDEMAALTKVANLLVNDQDFDVGMTAEIADALIAFDIESKNPGELADILSTDGRAGLFFRELVTQAVNGTYMNNR